MRNDQAMQNELAMNLYQYQFQREQADQQQRNWQATFDAQYGGDAGGGYGGGGSQNSNRYNDFMNEMGGGDDKKPTATTNSILPVIASESPVIKQSVYDAINAAAKKASSSTTFTNPLAADKNSKGYKTSVLTTKKGK